MLQLDGNVDVYKMECNRMLKYNAVLLPSSEARIA
jgi:hypothetical protein